MENEANEQVCVAPVRVLATPKAVETYIAEASKKLQLVVSQAQPSLVQKDVDVLIAYDELRSAEFEKVYKKLAHIRSQVKQLETEAVRLLGYKTGLVKRIDAYRLESDSAARIERLGPLFDLLKSTAKGRLLIGQQIGKAN